MKNERIKSQLLPRLAQITTFLLSRACRGKEALLERSLGRNEEQIEGGEKERKVSRQEGRGRKTERGIKHARKRVRLIVKSVCREKTK